MKEFQPVGPTIGNERLVEFLIVTLSRVAVDFRLGLDQYLDFRQLVLRADELRFPIQIGVGERLPQRVTLEQSTHFSDFAQVFDRDR